RGERDNLHYLKGFYFGNGYAGLQNLIKKGEEEIDPRVVCGIEVGKDSEGKVVEVRIGRYGPFLTDGENRASLPDDVPPDELTADKALEIIETAKLGPQSLGDHPELGLPVYLKNGRFGPYLQLGDMEEGEEKPKMASLLPGMEPQDVTFEVAVELLNLPKIVGKFPENNEDIEVANGRYGPYVKCGSDTRTIPMDDMSPLTITLDQAIELLKQPKRRGRTSQPKALKELGKHPATERLLTIKSGRFGPYVTDGEVNASLPKGHDPEEVTMDDAVNLLEARLAKLAAQGKTPGAKKTGKAKSKAKTSSKEKAKTKAKAKAKTKAKSKAKAKTKTKSKAKSKKE
ncbi:MAG: hypothetical protein KDD55_13040, partial [Bdellovibrionales bacterium]|nr:hypothetical protein [Bdellovibrionales bacterium]